MQRKIVFLLLLGIVTANLSIYSRTMKGTIVAKKEPVYLIDGSGFLYRAYYGIRPLHTSKGIPVHAVYSFCRMINKLANKFKPTYMALVWDSPGKTMRHEMYTDYKSTRQEPPSDLFTQKKYITKFADLIGLQQVQAPGIEADDLIYSLAKDLEKEGHPVVMVTSDKDMGQIISDLITFYDPFKDVILTRDDFQEKMGFPVEKLAFYHALLGDSSDNIPGVRGVGKKGATEVVQQFESLDDLYKNLDKVQKERIKKALEENKENAFLSHKLFLLQYIPLDIALKDLEYKKENWANARELFQELEFKSLVKELEKKAGIKSEKVGLVDVTDYRLKTIQTMKELQELCDAIRKAGVVAIDIESTGLRPLRADVIGLCVAYEKGTGYYIPFGHKTMELQLTKDEIFELFGPILQDPKIKKIMHHARFDQLSLYTCGQTSDDLAFDTLVAAALVTKDFENIGLKKLSMMYLNEPMLSYQDVVTDNKYKNLSFVPLKLSTEYAAADAHQTLQLYPILERMLQEQKMETLFYTIELPLVNVLLHMEIEGIYCDVSVLQEIDKKIIKDLAQLKEDILSLIGPEFKEINLNSPRQVGELLFEHLKLPKLKKSAKKTGYSTDVEVLKELGKLHPVPTLILKYRELFKLKSTYVDALPRYINPKTGRIHTNFTQTQVATGRLASSDPNLQNIPMDTAYDIHIRSAFKPKEGNVFLSADYSQIELRVLAYLSQDKALVDAFLQDRDIHAQTASKIFNVPLDKVTSAQRQIGKRINFSILYGLTPYGLSKDLDIPFKEAKEYIEAYFAQYPKVSEWMDATIESTKEHGYVTTYFGRRRYVPGIYEKNRMLFDLARRIAINTVAQGTAAEIMKLGMVRLEKKLKEAGLGAKMLLQIHDELLITVPANEKEKTEALVREVLENVVDWNIPLKVSTRFGLNWYDVTK